MGVLFIGPPLYPLLLNFHAYPLHISILRKYLHNLNKFMRSSSHFQFAVEASSAGSPQNLCKVTGKSGAQQTVIVIGLENERSAIGN